MKRYLAPIVAALALAFTAHAQAQTAPTPTVRTMTSTSPSGATTTFTTYSFSGVTSANLAATLTAAQAETPSGQSFQSLNVFKAGSTYMVTVQYR